MSDAAPFVHNSRFYAVEASNGRTYVIVNHPKAGTWTIAADGKVPITQIRGSVHFAPANGPAGIRKIEAIVEQDNRPRARLTVASYRAPASPRPGKARNPPSSRSRV